MSHLAVRRHLSATPNLQFPKYSARSLKTMSNINKLAFFCSIFMYP